MMSVNWSWTKRMPFAFASEMSSMPSTASYGATTDPASLAALPGALRAVRPVPVQTLVRGARE